MPTDKEVHPAAAERLGIDFYALPPWDGDHDFPHKRIARKVALASRPYRCQMPSPGPAGHTPDIATGAPYLRVSLRPDRNGSGGWRVVHLCRACGLYFRLASTEPYSHQPAKVRT